MEAITSKNIDKLKEMLKRDDLDPVLRRTLNTKVKELENNENILK